MGTFIFPIHFYQEENQDHQEIYLKTKQLWVSVVCRLSYGFPVILS